MTTNSSHGAKASPTFHRDALLSLQDHADSASISPSSRDVALVSRSGLSIIDLDDPEAEPRFIHYHVPSGAAEVQWSPHAFRDSWIVSTVGSNAVLWDLGHAHHSSPVVDEFKGHSRAITDINFSAHHPEILATCGIDTFVCLWDVRIPAQPVLRLADWHESASQVKFNRQDEHILASAHGGRFSIWDDRKGAVPIRSVEAHSTKIYGIDWHREYKDNILTCSLDETIKLWNWARANGSDDEAGRDAVDRVIRTGYPVWRARYTPFGHGILAMPQGADFGLHLYDSRTYRLADRDSNMTSVHTFSGHRSSVKEFLWRGRGGVEDGHDMRDFQLVSFSTDQTLRLHKLDHHTLQKVGYRKGAAFESSLRFTRKDAEYKSFVGHGSETTTLQHLPESVTRHSILPERSYTDFPILSEQWPVGGRESDAHAANEPATLSSDIVAVVESRRPMLTSPPLDGTRSERSSPSDAPKSHFGNGISGSKASRWQPQDRVTLNSRHSADAPGAKDFGIHGSFGDESRFSAPEIHTRSYLGGTDEVLEPIDLFEEEEDDEDDAVIGAFIKPSRASRSAGGASTNSNRRPQVPSVQTCSARWFANGTLVCLFPSTSRNNDLESASKIPDFRGVAGFVLAAPLPQRAASSDEESLASHHNSFRADLGGLLGASSLRFEHPPMSWGDNCFSLGDVRPTSHATAADSRTDSNEASAETRAGADARRPSGLSSFGTSGSLNATHRPGFPQGLSGSSMAGKTLVRRPQKQTSAVILRTLETLLPSKEFLAREYILGDNKEAVCRHNAAVCQRHGLEEHARTWEDTALLLRPTVPALNQQNSRTVGEKTAVQWRSGHPLGERMVKRIIERYEAQGDEQMLAMLAFVFGQPANLRRPKEALASQSASSSSEGDEDEGISMRRRVPTSAHRKDDTITVTWKNSHRFSQVARTSSSAGTGKMEARESSYILWRHRYAEILFGWGLYEARAQMLKANGNEGFGAEGLEISLKRPQERQWAEECDICSARLQGAGRYCQSGLHGMHESCYTLFVEQSNGMEMSSKAPDTCPFGCD